MAIRHEVKRAKSTGKSKIVGGDNTETHNQGRDEWQVLTFYALILAVVATFGLLIMGILAIVVIFSGGST